MTNITITDHDLFDTEVKTKRDGKKKKRSNSEHKNLFYPLGKKDDNKFVYISPSRAGGQKRLYDMGQFNKKFQEHTSSNDQI